MLVVAPTSPCEANEVDKRARLEAGVLGLYKMREKLAEKGLKWVDEAP